MSTKERRDTGPKAGLTEDLRSLLGDEEGTRDQIYTQIVTELRSVVGSVLEKGPSRPNPRVTQLVGEAWLRMVERRGAGWEDKRHFKAWIAKVTRSVLIDEARSRAALKRGGSRTQEALDDQAIVQADDHQRILDLDDALTKLAVADPKGAQIIELCFFGGLTQAEAAASLGIDPATAKRRARTARGWLRARMGVEHE